MYGVDWKEMQRIIFRYKKKNAYALLYLGELPCAAESAMKNNFERKISELVYINYQSFSGNTDVKILTIEGTKINGRHLSCDFVDVHDAELILSNYKTFHGAGGNTIRVEPHTDEARRENVSS